MCTQWNEIDQSIAQGELELFVRILSTTGLRPSRGSSADNRVGRDGGRGYNYSGCRLASAGDIKLVDTQIRDALLEQLAKLPVGAQRQVLDFAHGLSLSLQKTAAGQIGSRPVGVPGKSLLRFVGTISPEDCQIMTEAIEAGCERIDSHEW